MSTSVELPFWPIITETYRSIWSILKSNKTAFIALFIFLTCLQFTAISIADSYRSEMLITHDFGIRFSPFLIAQTTFFNLITLYIQSVIYIIVVRFSLFQVPPQSLYSAVFDYRAARLFGFNLLLLASLFIVNGLMIGAAFLAYYVHVIWASWLLGIGAILFAFWTIVLLARMVVMPAYIAADHEILSAFKITMNRLKWRFWKIYTLLFVVAMPFLIIELLLSFLGLESLVLDGADTTGQHAVPIHFGFNFKVASALNGSAYIVIGSVLLSLIAAAIFRRLEAQIAESAM